MKVTIDRISGSGNPIAEEQHGGEQIHVPDASVNETCEIEILATDQNFKIGLKEELPLDQKEQYRNMYETKESGKPDNREANQLPKGVDPQAMRQRVERQKSGANTKHASSSNEGNKNKNDLLNGKL